jgi:hypothetical protein
MKMKKAALIFLFILPLSLLAQQNFKAMEVRVGNCRGNFNLIQPRYTESVVVMDETNREITVFYPADGNTMKFKIQEFNFHFFPEGITTLRPETNKFGIVNILIDKDWNRTLLILVRGDQNCTIIGPLEEGL